MRKGRATVSALVWLVGGSTVQAQSSVDWIEPDGQRITVVDNAGEQRQVRFTGAWETADYVVFAWRDLRGEMVYLSANDDRVAIDFPLTLAEIPRLFHAGNAGEVTLGKSGRGSFLLGTAFGQRFTMAGSPLNCFSFLSSDLAQSANAGGLPQRTLYGYACATTEQPRAEIERFLRDIRFIGDGFVEDDAEPATAAVDAAHARQFALGGDGKGPTPQGLTEVPLGYAVRDPISGG